MTARDYIVVGSGLTGATIARMLADAGQEVLVLERRSAIGGNVRDEVHSSGIRLQTYGPHYFRTNSEELWAFVRRFAEFHPYEAVLKSLVDGRHENWPIAQSYIAEHAPEWTPVTQTSAENFEEACLQQMPRIVYEKFIKGYTEKQWGVPARSLDKSLFGRFDVRADDEPRLSRHRFQGIPIDGYSAFVEQMLGGIETRLHCDWLKERRAFEARKMLIFTGPIDEFFEYELGHLSYRAQRREHEFVEDQDLMQPCGQVNNPDSEHGEHIRTIEWKHMMPPGQLTGVQGTLLTREYPFSATRPDEFEYPFPNGANADLYKRYEQRAAAMPRLLVCGRLGEYRYYDMDQAIARALMLGRRLLARER